MNVYVIQDGTPASKLVHWCLADDGLNVTSVTGQEELAQLLRQDTDSVVVYHVEVPPETKVTQIEKLKELAEHTKFLDIEPPSGPELSQADATLRVPFHADDLAIAVRMLAESSSLPARRNAMPDLIPHLWFDGDAEHAAEFYTRIFPNSKITETVRYPEAAKEVGGTPGSVMTVDFELDGHTFVALNGGPEFTFSEAISFMIPCKDQKEVDFYWERLLEGGGEESMCGWLKDRFGVSWQVVPDRLSEMMRDDNQAKVEAVTASFLKMRKLDLPTLEEAYKAA